MAKQEHLEPLKQGVELWNAWREQLKKEIDWMEEYYYVDLSGADLREETEQLTLLWLPYRSATVLSELRTQKSLPGMGNAHLLLIDL